MAFVNKTNDKKFDNLQELQEFYKQEATHPTEKNKKRDCELFWDSSDSESNKSASTSNSESSSNKKPKAKKIMFDVSNFKS